MTRLARRLRPTLAAVLSAAVVVFSPGLEAPRLFAQVIGAASVSAVRAVPALPVAAPAASLPISAVAAPSAVSLTAPALTAAPAPAAAPASAAAVAAPAAARAAAVPEMAKALAPHLEALSRPDAGAAGAAAAGRGIEDVVTGRRSIGSGDVSSVMGAVGAAAPALPAASAAPSDPSRPSVPAAAAPAEGKVVASEVSYRVHRFLLKAVAALTGAAYSLPVAGPALTAKLIRSAADKRAVFSDYDDTLAAYNQVLPEDMVSAIQAVKAAGKDFVVISDRGDEPRPHQLSVFESLATLPVETRAGMYVAANSGGRVYRYDEKGEPVRQFEAPALSDEAKAKVAQAAEATKARLKEVGAEQHVPTGTDKNPSESWGTYGYALMLKVGSSDAQVKGAAAIMQEELAKRGLQVEVNPRFAKDPANPPYINFSIVTKQTSAEYIAQALRLSPRETIVIGDSMYAPVEAKKESWLTRLGASLSGRAMPKTGNRTDRNMEKALPGALTLSVGTTGDASASNLWVLSGKGPSLTRQVLMSMASKPRSEADKGSDALHIAGAAALVAGAAASYYFIGHALVDWLSAAEQSLRQGGREIVDGGLMFGGMLGWWKGPWAKPGDDKAARYAEIESGHSALLRAVPGVASVKVADNDFFYGGNLNDSEGKLIRVVFQDVVSYQKALPSLPKVLPALEGVPDVKQYNVVPSVEKKALKAAYAALEAEHARALAAVPGAVSVKVEDYDFFYGGNLNDSEGKNIRVVFSDLASYRKALAELPKTLPALDGVPAVKRYNLILEVGKNAQKGEYRTIEAGYVAQLSAVPGVESVKVEDSDFWGVNTNRSEGKNIRMVFRDVDSYHAALPSLPKTLSALAKVDTVSRYNVLPEVAKGARKAAYEALEDGYRARFAGIPGVVGVTLKHSSSLYVDNDDSNSGKNIILTFDGVTSMRAAEAAGLIPATVPAIAAVPDIRHYNVLTEVAPAPSFARRLADRARRGFVAASPFLSWLGLAGLTAAVYGAIFYAATHGAAAPSSVQLPEGWQGAVPQGGWEMLFGGVLGAASLRGAGKAKVTDEEIESAAKGVIASKGGVWSQTEYNMSYYMTLESLQKRGATKAQLERFRKLCDEAPVKGGRFNPWSGD